MEVGTEQPTTHGWRWTVSIAWTDADPSDHDVSLSWADHDHLTGGAIAPHRTAEAVAGVAAGRLGRAALPRRFDASTARRLIGGFDDGVREFLSLP